MKLSGSVNRSVLFGLWLLGLAVFILPANALAEADYVSGQLLVKFQNHDQVFRIMTDEATDLPSLIERYKDLEGVEYLEPNYLFKQSAFPNDENYYRQWYVFQVKAKDAWSQDLLLHEQFASLKKPVIAILDSGVYADHPDLKNKIWQNTKEIVNDGLDNDGNGFVDDRFGWNFVENNNNVNPVAAGSYAIDAVNHGTLIAGIAAAENNNTLGIAGISWFAKIMPLKVLDGNGSGDVYSVIKAIEYALNNGADVINMSFIGDGYSQSLSAAIAQANRRGLVFVAAAGNSDPTINGNDMSLKKSYPVCYDGLTGENLVIGVASVGKDLVKSNFSNYGDCVDLAAPGEDIYSTQFQASNNSDFAAYYGGGWSGTSLAVPMVSAVAATIKALRPEFTPAQIRDYIMSNTDNIYNYNPAFINQLGSGILNADKALAAVLAQSLPQRPVVGDQNRYLIAGLGFKSFPQIKILRSDGNEFKRLFSYSTTFNGPVFAAAGDLNGDGISELITYPGQGGGPHVRVITMDGQLIAQFFAYDRFFYGGLSLAAGDLNGDGLDEIITAPARSHKAEVKIFDRSGKQLGSFIAYENFNGGLNLAIGDINHDGKAEIITGPGAGGAPLVKIFDQSGKVLHQFYVFNSMIKSGVNVACGDVHGDGQPEIIVALGKNYQPEIRYYSFLGARLGGFFAGELDYYSGYNLAAGDIDGDGAAEIIVGSGQGSEPRLKAFDRLGKLKLNYLVHDAAYRGGVRPSFIRY